MLTVLHGDCVEELRKLPAESVHLCVTSPPYWGLRNYDLPPSVWGGDPGCAHVWGLAINGKRKSGGTESSGLGKYDNALSPEAIREKIGHQSHGGGKSAFCAKCGAWRGCFGLEPTPDLYVEHSVMIFAEVRRVLRSDGTLWINLGDSFSGSGKGGQSEEKRSANWQPVYENKGLVPEGRKAGDLVGIPWLVAFALQRAGWWLRRDNIWFKPNPMPESVNGWRWERCRGKQRLMVDGTASPLVDGENRAAGPRSKNHQPSTLDHQPAACPGCAKCEAHGGFILRKGSWRCTTSHEYVFQFSKSASYFCDAEAAREGGAIVRAEGPNSGLVKSRVPREYDDKPNPSRSLIRKSDAVGANGRNVQSNGSEAERRDAICSFNNNPALRPNCDRNLRSVWRITTKPYREAHFATFPPDLVRPIIKAASPAACCGACGAPWAPVVERGQRDVASGERETAETESLYPKGSTANRLALLRQAARENGGEYQNTRRVSGHRPTCGCNAPAAAACVLDPFGGSGTTGQVALELGRRAILIELNESYLPLIARRCAVTPGLPMQTSQTGGTPEKARGTRALPEPTTSARALPNR